MRLDTTSGTLATMRVCVLVGILAACGSNEASSNEANEPAPEPAPRVAERAEPTEVVPAVIRVINDTDETLVLDRSFGPASPLGIVGPGMERPLELDQTDDDASGNWLETCQCRCADEACPDCEAPETVRVTLAPGDVYLFEWNGKLRRRRPHRRGGACWTTILTQPGEYVFTACTEGGRCGRAEVTLPTSSIEIHLDNRAHSESCDDYGAERAWGIRGRVVDQLSYVLRDRPLDECVRVSCVSAETLEAELQASREHPCTIFIVPRGHEVEARAFLPLPAGTNGGESYANFFDPDVTRLLRAQYEQ